MSLLDKFDYLKTAKNFLGGDNLSNVRNDPESILPDHYIHSINDVSPEFLHGKGIEGIIWDVDNTLMKYHGQDIDKTVLEAFNSFGGFKQVILSNSGEKRFQELGEIFADRQMPILRMYETPEGDVIYRSLTAHYDEFWKYNDDDQKVRLYDGARGKGPEEHEFLKDAKVIKKPDPRLIEFAAREMGVGNLTKVAMIGDKAMTDILGGNQAGTYTLQVYPPMYENSIPFGPKIAASYENHLVNKYLRSQTRVRDFLR